MIAGERLERRTALLQLAGLVIPIGLLVAISVRIASAPAGAAELRIAVGELRSKAAEVELIAGESRRGNLDARFARLHAMQLARATKDSFHTLAWLAVQPRLEEDKAEAMVRGLELITQVSQLRAGAQPPEPAASRTRHDLDRLERALEH